MHSLSRIEEMLDAAATALGHADVPTAQVKLEELRALVAPDQLLTTGEAATLLGIRSVNTVKALARAGKLPFQQDPGKQMRLPLAGVLAFRDTRDFQRLATSEQIHDETADLGNDVIPPEALDDMTAVPGSLPWHHR